MRKRMMLAGLVLLPGLAFSGPPEFDEDFMQAVEDTHKSLSSNLAIQNAEGANVDAKLLEGYFADIEAKFIQAGDVQDGVALATQSRTGIAEVLKGLAANDFDAAAKASSQVGQACKECHKLYRQD